MGRASYPQPRKRLTWRIVRLSTVALVLVLAMIGGTLWLSWQLQGAGAAINDAGSLRMRANAVGIALLTTQPDGDRSALNAQIDHMNATLASLRQGDPARPLFLPDDAGIRQQFDTVEYVWRSALEQQARYASSASAYLAALPPFVAQADALVSLIERDNARKTAWLRTSQVALAAMSCLGTVAIVYLLFVWFVAPVQRLQEGLLRIRKRQFEARLPVMTLDEFGQLAAGFNHMAAELQQLYGELAKRVESNMAELEAQNRELSALYEMTAFLNLPNDVGALCQGFISRLTREFGAYGATVRLMSEEDGHLHLIAYEGLPEELVNAERSMPPNDCLCGDAAAHGAPVVHHMSRATRPRCHRNDFNGLVAFGIVSQGEARLLLAAFQASARVSSFGNAASRNARQTFRHGRQESAPRGARAAIGGVGRAQPRRSGTA